MTGAYRRDSGVLEYDQGPVAFKNPTESAGGRHRSRLPGDPARGFPNRCREYFFLAGAYHLGIDRRRM